MKREIGILFIRYKSLIERNIAISFAVGFLLHIIPFTRPFALFVTPFFLLIAGLFVLFSVSFPPDRYLFVWYAVVFLLTFFIEVIGVNTGLVFGSYAYGPVLGPAIFGVPPLIGLNWTIIILGTTIFFAHKINNIFLSALLTASACLVFDIILEPVAMHFNYWRWAGGTIPFQNYLAWFLISLCASISLLAGKKKYGNFLPAFYVFIQAAFFFSLLVFIFIAEWSHEIFL
ncbi:MAG: carotenoid biosynthesis protein [Spirochaetales bacterium]|nr:carotenoid biosynthesis protein [Spirochaetales bacterium]